jgi:ankyrin repeat protein
VKHCAPLHMAARRGNVVIAHALVGSGAEIEARDTNGDTPLHRAVKCGQAEMVAFLLSHGADVQARAKNGKTPWQMARGARIQAALQTYASRNSQR